MTLPEGPLNLYFLRPPKRTRRGREFGWGQVIADEVVEPGRGNPRVRPLGYLLTEVSSGRLILADRGEDPLLRLYAEQCLAYEDEEPARRLSSEERYANLWRKRDGIIKQWRKQRRPPPSPGREWKPLEPSESHLDIAARVALAGRERDFIEANAPHVVGPTLTRSVELSEVWRRWHDAGLQVAEARIPVTCYETPSPSMALRAELWWLIDHRVRVRPCKYCGGWFVPTHWKQGYCYEHRTPLFRQYVERGKKPPPADY